jgi:hypothetical protein
MALVFAGSRRTVVVLAFCECVATSRHAPASLDMPGLDLSRAADTPAITRVRRVHWLVAGWLIGVTVLVIARATPGAR